MSVTEKEVQEASSHGRVLIVTAVDAERDAVLRGLRGDERFDVIAAGVGPAAAAAVTAVKIASAAAGAGKAAAEAGDHRAGLVAATGEGSGAGAGAYRLVISAGIAGGFPGRAPIGSLVVATDMIAADLGVETPDGFASVDELGFGSSRILADARLASALAAKLGGAAGLTVSTGPVLTVTTATGTAATAAEHLRRVPGATAEAMEGFGVAIAAQHAGLPVLELRAISNAVGPRDRDAWRIGDALRALEQASTILTEVLSS
ncbi:futalosine hydrolase [Paenibacillus albus]|uniref:Futalosine hydrolase n=1 Tax=Paenibacillus albus TaxID=2495582 RepID=A0A3S9ACP7_9BACL|nr:futalosine hydrolase [Paenibacillus albus]AZN43488.1 futalosine hydrolase [Paenibacillus albus]